MRKLQYLFWLFFPCLFLGCSSSISNEQKNEITKTVVEAQLDSIYAFINAFDEPIESPDEYHRVLLLQGKFVNQEISDSIEKALKFPFIAVRTDSNDIEVIKGKAQTKAGKEFEYVEESNDKATGVPIFTMIVDSLEVFSSQRVSVHLYEADHKSVHFQGLKWWLNFENGKWAPDSVQTLWIN